MEYTLETTYCDDNSRQFAFCLEQKLLNFVKQHEEITIFENMTSYQRMITHLICEHYGLIAKSSDKRGEESKSNDNIKNVIITKTSVIKEPLLKLYDYLNKRQKEKHEIIFKEREYGSTSYKNRKSNIGNEAFNHTRNKQKWQREKSPEEQRNLYNCCSNGKSIKYEVKYSEKGIEIDANGSTTIDKQPKSAIIDRINCILTSTKDEKSLSNILIERKDQDDISTIQQINISSASTCHQIPLNSTFTQKLTKNKVYSNININESNTHTFLPSVNHILIFYFTKEPVKKSAMQDHIFKLLEINVELRLFDQTQGFLICECEYDADKIIQYKRFDNFEVLQLNKAHKDKFKELFKNEYYSLSNMRPKTDKSAALRMINGHLKIKQV